MADVIIRSAERAACEESRCTDDQGEVTFAAMYDTLREDSKRGDELIGFSVNMMGDPASFGIWEMASEKSRLKILGRERCRYQKLCRRL